MDVQLENIATPQEDSTPQLRYASLHRTVERGMASDEILRELVEICLQLGHADEAVRVHSGMKAGPVRDHVGALLARRGLISRSAEHQAVEDDGLDDSEPSVAEHVLDAVQYLCQGHMPAIALLTMLAFPVVVGLGGFLTSGGSPWLFAGLAALPGLCVLGVVGAMGRQIFLQSAEGEEEVPAIPAPADMVALARRYLSDVMIVLGALVAPSLTLLWFNAPLVSSLPGLAIGMFLTPIALILRQIRGDLGALSPVALIRGIGCCDGYARVTGAFWIGFAPAAIAFWSSLSHAVWLQIAIVGPLAVLPMFGTARLLGTFTDSHRSRLGLLLQSHNGKGKPTTTGKPAGATPALAAKTTASKPAGNKPAFGAPPKPFSALGSKTPFARKLAERRHTPLEPRNRPPAPSMALGNMHPQLGGLGGLGEAPAKPAAAAPKSAPKTTPNAPPAPLKKPLAAPTPAPAAPARTTRPATPVKQPSSLPAKPDQIARKAEQSTPQPGGLARRPSPEDWMVEQPRKAPAQPAAHIEGRAPKAPAKPAPKAPPTPAPAPAPAPAAKTTRSAPPRPAPKAAPTEEVDDKGFAGPDLSNMPGATVISAEDRERLGAASRRR